MSKTINFTVELTIDGRRSIVTASTDAEKLAQNLAAAKSQSEKLRGSLL